jgi:hypothetical protein
MKIFFKYAFLFMLVLWGLKGTSQKSFITGKIYDTETKALLENASILIKETEISTLSDAFGHFSFNGILPSNFTLQISHIGYATQFINVTDTNKQNVVAVSLSKSRLSFTGITINSNKLTTYNKIAALDLLLRPLNSSQDALKIVPGLFIAQHAGGGKAEQIFLRGFDIDHGTDINITVDGLPVNMISHAHGQGYADLHFLIPETIEKINFDKGPYNAQKGNLATAGYVDFKTKDFIEHNTIKIEAGSFNTQRLASQFNLFSQQKANAKKQLYLATEYNKSNGYFESPQHFNRFNAMVKYSAIQNDNSKLTILASTFTSKWNASGQIPERAVENGLIKRFGAIDDKEGGTTSRTNFSIQFFKKLASNWDVDQQLYFTNYNFNLFSNFTFFLNDSIDGDMINQKEKRNIYGYSTKLKKSFLLNNAKNTLEFGTGIRYDDVANIELSNAPNRVVKSIIQKGAIKETNAYAYINNTLEPSNNFSINASARFDFFKFGYKNIAQNETHFQSQQKAVISPKLTLNYKLSNKATVYLNNGIGFHSNDTRVILNNTITEILPKVYGTDLGLVLKPNPNFFLKTTLWHLYSQQEFVYVGDAGIVEPSGRSRRFGIDVLARYQLNKWLFADVDINVTKAIDEEKGEDYIPLAPSFTSIGGLSAKFSNKINASLRYRFIDNRPASEDYSVVAKGYFLMDAVVNYKFKKFDCSLSAENILNQQWKEAQFNTESKLLTETNAVSEIHYTPGSPFFIKFGVSVSF